jgi:inosine-uridine nucleoside N-ribohydrolase
MHKIVWDMDPGIDDALALILALKSPEAKILGITTVAGNAPVEMTSVNALRVLECLGAVNIPVARGSTHPLNRPLEDALGYHGSDGLGNCGLPSPLTSMHPLKAWDFLVRSVLDAPGEVTLVATGPLTNVACAFELQPRLPELLARLVLMGGAYRLTPYGKGNRTPFAEFNIWEDPEAAYMVFNSGVDIFAVGLDVTMDPAACLNSQHLEQIRTGQTLAARLVAQLVEYEVKYHGCCRMHDPLALAVLLNDSLLDFTLAKVEVVKGNNWDRGATHILPSDSLQLIHIASAVDGPSFLKLFLSRILEV